MKFMDYFSPNEQGIYVPQGSGGVAQRLMSANMQPGALRPWLHSDGRSYITVNVNGKPKSVLANTTATLRYDEWKAIDQAIVKIARERLVAANDLQANGLTYPISNGLGSTVLQWETQSDFEAAEMDMEARKSSAEDRTVFETNYMPLPIIHKSFSISLRTLEASRTSGDPLDTVNAENAARQVVEKVEDVILLGASSFAYGGGTLYGYKDHINRNTVTLASNWDASSTTGEDILDDVLAMLKSATNDRHYGDFILYIPTDYDDILDNDFKSYSDKSIRQRLLEIPKIQAIRAADRLTDNHVLLVEMRPETVKLVIGLPMTTLQWEEQGGLLLKFKIMTIMLPWIRSDQDGRLGIVHLSA